ncbi:transcriptional regulator, MarR family [Methanolacinia petrolearia DSM 11571]|uniref:Transcriptional regulator, MarR family n=1 Tax=Methanolacinia petrolearia (strain DSM 11571 / OCM 486 / SEBR 4847) TaxID=679926 RepID=E1RGC3_METP4|nr:MarR family transcriptional regulator [Methanolacinia petrolearia]ADN37437.1 transcriptional regulator, MarR family [Methanolacinia petrolearia DSM 11571]
MQDILNKDIPLGGLFSIIYRSRNIYLNNSMNTTGLSQGQVFALITLSKENNITQDRIAELFYLDKGTVARAVRKLEDSGYICRTQDPDNRRAHRLSLTEKGEKILPYIKEIANKWDKDVCKGFSPEDLDKFNSLLRTICERSLLSAMEVPGYGDRL